MRTIFLGKDANGEMYLFIARPIWVRESNSWHPSDDAGYLHYYATDCADLKPGECREVTLTTIGETIIGGEQQ